jgi:lysozyme family protein
VAEAAPSPSRFRPCVDFVIDRLEGGAKLITDQGGATRFGISHRGHPGVDIEHLTRDGACSIYLSDYWEPNNCALMPAGLDLLLFAAAMNMGSRQAVKLLQVCLRVAEDGMPGAATVGAARRYLSQQDLRARFNEKCLEHYALLARENPALHGSSLLGWRLRVLRVADEAGRQSC